MSISFDGYRAGRCRRGERGVYVRGTKGELERRPASWPGSDVDFPWTLRYVGPAMSELFYDPDVLKMIRAILVSKGIRDKEDLRDSINDVVLKCIETVDRSGLPPKDVAGAKAIARPIAQAHGADEARKRFRRGSVNVGSTGDADEHAHQTERAPDPVDTKRILAAIGEVLTEEQMKEYADIGAGVSQKELAADAGVTEAAKNKQVQRGRVVAKSAMGAKGYWVAGFGALIAGMATLYIRSSHEPDNVTGGRKQAAAQERRLAADACHEKRWDDCERVLDVAKQLDEEGDREPDVAKLRAEIAEGRGAVRASDGGGLPHGDR